MQYGQHHTSPPHDSLRRSALVALRPSATSTFPFGAALLLTFLVFLAFFPISAGAVLVCGTPGSAGTGFPSGAINDFWAGSGSPASGNSSITLGARRAGGAGNSIAAGDMVLIIQMQDADINSTNTAAYGGNNGSGSGATAVNRSGLYEYVLATSAVGAGGGTLNFTPALTNSYRTRNYTAGSNGQSRWQAIRVPQYSSATASNVTAPAWDGSTGGVVAMDVENTLNLAGGTAVNVAGLGFRGGLGRTLGGAAGADTDFRTLASTNTNAAKGEGIAGTPRFVNNTSAYNAAPALLDTGIEGYPNGSYARGAPGNAGGGGTDGNPPANDQNSGGGGGSNYGFGGQGGDAWNSGDASGGRGGAPFSGNLAPNRVFLGGGGGAGTTNNGTSDAATYTNPPGVACTAGGGYCSSGAAGGGIVLIRAGSIAGSGLIDASGSDAYNVENDGAGGGGGGGTVVLQSYFGGSANVDVSGGDGGNAWRSRNTLIDRHGPGGGGGGGFIAYSPSSGFAVNANYAAGLAGKSANNDPFGSTSGNGGFSTFDLPNIPGVPAGTFCPPAIKAVSLAVDNGVAGAIDPGDTLEYTVVYRNGSTTTISGFNITDPLPAEVNFVPGSLTVTPSGGAAANANGAYDGSAATSLLASNITLPSGGIVTARLRVTANGATCASIFNQANSVQSSGDILGMTDNADNLQNEGGLPPGTYLSQASYATGGATDPTGFTMGCPDLSTSTKSWVDLNGGDQEPGDEIIYTLTLNESGGGGVSGVTVTDDIPAGVNSFQVLTYPAGATNSSSTGGGANGTGYLNITNIPVPAGGSATITFKVKLDAALPAGWTIDNSATITNPLGPGATPAAPTLTVAASSIPVTGIKQLYGQPPTSGLAGDLLRTPSTVNPINANRYWLNGVSTATFTLNPALQKPLDLDPDYWLVLQMLLNSNRNRTVSFTTTLQYRVGAAVTVLDSRTFNQPMTNGTLVSYPYSFTMPAVTVPQGAALELLVTNNSGRDVWLFPYNPAAGETTRVELNALTVINVDAIDLFDNGGTPLIGAAPQGSTVRIRASVSDPFGSYDITAARITLTDPLGTVQVSSQPMNVYSDSGAATKVFEYSYTLDAAAEPGNWDIRVDADEGSEGAISDFKNGALPVAAPLPALTILKSSSVYSDPVNGTASPRAIPGAVVVYTITTTNFGPGSPDTDSMIYSDPIPANTSLFVDDLGQGGPVLFLDGDADSGFTAPPLPFSLDYSSKAACNTFGYTPVSSGGYDANVCRLRIQMLGTINGSNGSTTPDFSLQFRVRIN